MDSLKNVKIDIDKVIERLVDREKGEYPNTYDDYAILGEFHPVKFGIKFFVHDKKIRNKRRELITKMMVQLVKKKLTISILS